jgi:hypothetical protein
MRPVRSRLAPTAGTIRRPGRRRRALPYAAPPCCVTRRGDDRARPEPARIRAATWRMPTLQMTSRQIAQEFLQPLLEQRQQRLRDLPPEPDMNERRDARQSSDACCCASRTCYVTWSRRKCFAPSTASGSFRKFSPISGSITSTSSQTRASPESILRLTSVTPSGRTCWGAFAICLVRPRRARRCSSISTTLAAPTRRLRRRPAPISTDSSAPVAGEVARGRAVVDLAAATFRATDGDLREVVRVIVTSAEFFRRREPTRGRSSLSSRRCVPPVPT